MTRILSPIVGSLCLLGLAACAPGDTEREYEPPELAASSYSETGDLEAITEHGTLRLLVPSALVDDARGDRGDDSPIHEQVRHAAEFARSLDLEPVIVPVDDSARLVSALEEGRGDLIVANLPMTDFHRDRVRFTVPLDRSRRMVVARADDPIAELGELGERSLVVPFDTHLWATARELQQQYDGLNVESLPALDDHRRLALLADGDIDLTLAESNFLDAELDGNSELRAALPVSEESGIAWAVRDDASELHDMLNRFITQQQLAEPEREQRTADLPGIRDSQTLRVATRNSAANYFVWRGQFLGFEYELSERLANELGLRLEIVVADEDESLLELVRAGKADIAAAFLSPVARDDDDGIAWSRPYHQAQQLVVGRSDAEEEIATIDDLDGTTFHVAAGSRYETMLELLRAADDIDIAIETLPPGTEPEAALMGVASGDYELTLADEHLVTNAGLWLDGITDNLPLGREISHHWAVRADNPELLAAVDGFLAREYRGTVYNTLYAKYFRDAERARGFNSQRIDLEHGRQISPWDDVVREYATEYGFDWRLILAQLYQESSFNPESRSWVGAQGLMQIMPATAAELGIEDQITDPEANIHAGIRYLDWLRDRFEEDLRVEDRMWFMLAAYNAGVGHVRDARRLAAELGLDRDRWFDNVEVAMAKLSEPEYFQQARFGYVRGQEPVNYVRDIRERYRSYILWTDECWPVCQESPHPQELEPRRSPGGLLEATR